MDVNTKVIDMRLISQLVHKPPAGRLTEQGARRFNPMSEEEGLIKNKKKQHLAFTTSVFRIQHVIMS